MQNRQWKRRLLAAIALLLLLATMLSAVVSAVSVSFNDILSASMDIIRQNEGDYTSVNKNDNGALSVGWIQWHGNRALNLLKDIVAANESQAKKLLGDKLYNEIKTATDWSTRVVTEAEAGALSALLGTAEGKKAQDALAANDISAYINRSMGYGITSPSALVYLADVENQCGAGGCKRVITAAAELAGGDYSKITLQIAHKAALADAAAGKYETRRNKVYGFALALGWDAVSLTDEVWKTDTSINTRSGPGTSYSLVSSYASGTTIFVIRKVAVNGSTWGETYVGWVNLGYCSYVSGSVPSPVTFDLAGENLPAPKAKISYTHYNNGRPADALAVFTTDYGASTRTNAYGREAIVDSTGLVKDAPKYGVGNSAIPKGGFVLSGHGTMDKWIASNVRAGDYVAVDTVSGTVLVYKTRDAYLLRHKTFQSGAKLGTLPTVEKDGYVFEGWYTAPSGGTQVTSATVRAEHTGITLYAHFRERSMTRVTFDMNGGMPEGLLKQAIHGVNIYRDADYLVIYDAGTTTGTNKYGAEAIVGADGQVTAVTGYGVGNSTIPAGGFVVSGHDSMATWITQNIHVGDYITYSGAQLTLTIYPAKNATAVFGKWVRENTAVGALPTVVRENYGFTGWYTVDGTLVTEETVVPPEGLALVAGWKQQAVLLTLDPGAGTLHPVKAQVKADGVNVVRTSNTLVIFTPAKGATSGTNSYGGEAVIASDGKVISVGGYGTGNSAIPAGGYVLSGHGTMLLWLTKNLSVGDYVNIDLKTLQVTVYTPEAYLTPDAVWARIGEPIGTLPVPVLKDARFVGWFTAPAGGERISETTVSAFTEDAVLYAQYESTLQTLSFDAGIGAGAPDPIVFSEGGSAVIPETTPDGGCYAFLGWAIVPGGEAVYHPGDVYTGGTATLYAVYAEHGFTEHCTAAYEGKDAHGDCVYAYVCNRCGYTGKFTCPAAEVLNRVSLRETVNGDVLTVYVALGRNVPLSDCTVTIQYDPTRLSFLKSTVPVSNTEAGHCELRLTAEQIQKGYVKLFFTGANGKLPATHYVKPQFTGTLSAGQHAGLSAAFEVTSHVTLQGASVLGDVDGDGQLAVTDMILLSRAVAGVADVPYPDIDGDGVVTTMDLVLLRSILAGRIREFYNID